MKKLLTEQLTMSQINGLDLALTLKLDLTISQIMFENFNSWLGEV